MTRDPTARTRAAIETALSYVTAGLTISLHVDHDLATEAETRAAADLTRAGTRASIDVVKALAMVFSDTIVDLSLSHGVDPRQMWQAIAVDRRQRLEDMRKRHGAGKEAPGNDHRSSRPPRRLRPPAPRPSRLRPARGLGARRRSASIFWPRPRRPARLSNPHSLRHFCAKVLQRDGLDVTEVASRLGDSVAVVLATYAHWIRNDGGRTRAAVWT